MVCYTTAINMLSVIVLMALAGVLGSYCGEFFNETKDKRPAYKVVAPGLLASFCVPLFLNIGKSEIVHDLIQDNVLREETFVLFGFCSLAAVYSKNFVNALAKRALDAASEADRKASEVKRDVQQVSEKVENVEDNLNEVVMNPIDSIYAQEGDKNTVEESTLILELAEKIDPIERDVLKAMMRSKYSLRAMWGIIRDTKEINGSYDNEAIRLALSRLISRGLVVEIPSNINNRILYQVVLKHNS